MSTAGQRRALGRYGESVAARRLVADGMVLLDRNWRCELGEIDLVLRDGPVLVVCEVKTRVQRRLRLTRWRRCARPRPSGSAGWPTGGARTTTCRPTRSGSTWSGCSRTATALAAVDHVRGVG